MAGKYEGLAKIIVQNVGGRTNIISLDQNGSTLSFELKDFGRANTDILKGTDGIAAVENTGIRYEISVKKDPVGVYSAVAERAGLAADGLPGASSSQSGISRIFLFIVSFLVAFLVIAAVNTFFIGGIIQFSTELIFAFAAAFIGLMAGALLSRSPENREPAQISPNREDELESKPPVSEKLGSPVEGLARELSEIEDQAFASGALGKGIWFEPKSGRLYAPCDGTLTTLFESGHAVGISSDSGARVLIHIGMNTVMLKGEGFNVRRRQGDYVKRGELLIEFDMEGIHSAGYSLDTPMVVENTEEYSDVSIIKTGAVRPGENVLNLKG